MEIDEIVLKYYEWEIICHSPFEIKNHDGSFATTQAAHLVLDALKESYKEEVLQKPIVLTFGVDNHFDPVSLGRSESGVHFDFATSAQWLIGCAEQAITDSNFPPHSPRHIEMKRLCESLREQLRGQLTNEECEELKLN